MLKKCQFTTKYETFYLSIFDDTYKRIFFTLVKEPNIAGVSQQTTLHQNKKNT
jgi:hypothetical protein